MGKRTQNNVSSVDELSPENVLVNWMTTVATFHLHYNQLANLLSACRLQQRSAIDLGQCSIQQLERLLARMQQELACLLADMNQSGPTVAQRDCQRLVVHTQVLDQLNRQAQKLLVLTSLSAS